MTEKEVNFESLIHKVQASNLAEDEKEQIIYLIKDSTLYMLKDLNSWADSIDWNSF